MKTLIVSIFIVAGMAFGTAQADPFVFTATNSAEPAVKGVPTPDGQVAVVSFNSTGATVFASGVTETWTSECHQLTSPTLQYDAQGFCITTLDDNTSLFVVMVCNSTGDEMGQANCWGYFTGGTGRYETANGTLTWQSSDGKISGGGNLSAVAPETTAAPPAPAAAVPAQPEAPAAMEPAEAEVPAAPAVVVPAEIEVPAAPVIVVPAEVEIPAATVVIEPAEAESADEAAAEPEMPAEAEASADEDGGEAPAEAE